MLKINMTKYFPHADEQIHVALCCQKHKCCWCSQHQVTNPSPSFLIIIIIIIIIGITTFIVVIIIIIY